MRRTHQQILEQKSVYKDINMNNQITCKCGVTGTKYDVPFIFSDVDYQLSSDILCDNCLIKSDGSKDLFFDSAYDVTIICEGCGIPITDKAGEPNRYMSDHDNNYCKKCCTM